MDFNIEQQNELWVVTPTGDRLDAAQAVAFKEALKQIVDDGANVMLLDLSNIQFLDSSGLGALVAHLKYMGVERQFELCGLTPTVEKVFKLTRMDGIFKIYSDRAAAFLSAEAKAG